MNAVINERIVDHLTEVAKEQTDVAQAAVHAIALAIVELVERGDCPEVPGFDPCPTPLPDGATYDVAVRVCIACWQRYLMAPSEAR